MAVEERLKNLEETNSKLVGKVDQALEQLGQIQGQLQVVSPRDMVQMKTDLARVETRVYTISGFIAVLMTTVAGWIKGLIT